MIVLPKLFQETLSSDGSLSASVRQSLDLFEPWLEQSGMPFFPGFTDHSPKHVNDVLATAASIISDGAREKLSPRDVAVLVLSVLLHDCGMHLTQDGFRALVRVNTPVQLAELGDKRWDQLWTDFLQEANRFGEDKLIAIFGDALPVDTNALNLDSLSERDCLLIGEFVRRHHARLAHEIAIAGVPTNAEVKLELVGLDAELRDIAGLCARSHGMAIRSSFDYIRRKYGLLPECREVKIPFLMAVLRIADYVQVHGERAIRSLLSVKELRSPISRQEWRNHFAVADVSTSHDDPEALYIHALPKDVKTFLKLQRLFRDIQRELDDSWATLGEVYGRFQEFRDLGITIRRIRSNIDDIAEFAKAVSYIPIDVGLRTSGADLLKLLVGPLYDYDPSIAIRELVQNAVDACREREDISGPADTNSDYSVRVEILEADDGSGEITVTDTGVGMTLDTVQKYFLVAGASFRNSDVWKAQHTDLQGVPKVLRGGRFGVGVLAAFLLGDELVVRTRHLTATEDQGIQFRLRMDDPVVEVRQSKLPIGTSISVAVRSADVLNQLRPWDERLQDDDVFSRWESVDWFAQTHPKVEVFWNGFDDGLQRGERSSDGYRYEGRFSPKDALVPCLDGDLDGWRTIVEPTDFKLVQWAYRENEDESIERDPQYHRLPRVTILNGMRVRSRDNALEYRSEYRRDFLALEPGRLDLDQRVVRPSVSIHDPLGCAPINLQRSAIAFDRMGIDSVPGRSILTEWVERITELIPSAPLLGDFQTLCEKAAALPAVAFNGQVVTPLCACDKGVFLASPQLFWSLNIHTLYFIDMPFGEKERASVPIPLASGEALMLRWNADGEQKRLGWFRAMFADAVSEPWRTFGTGAPQLFKALAYGYVGKKLWKLANIEGKVSKALLACLESKSLANGDVCLATNFAGTPIQVKETLANIAATLGHGNYEVLASWSLEPGRAPDFQPSFITDEWLKNVPDGILRWKAT